MRSATTILLAALTASLAPMGAGCDSDLALKNARPRVTWVALERIGDGDPSCPFSSCARVTMWLADVEGDAVDVVASWTAGGQRGELELAAGSYPLRGLQTRVDQNSADGTPHQVIWDLADVPTGTVVLELTVDDRPYDTASGDVYQTPAVDPRADVAPVTPTRE